MSTFEVTGKLIVKYNTQQVTEKFRKREFVIEIPSGMYSEQVKFQLTQDKCSLLDGYEVGAEIKVSFNLRGRPYTKGNETTYFTNLEAWKIEGNAPAASAPSAHDFGGSGFGLPPEPADDGDLPF